MKLLLDTQLLLWAAGQPERLSASARKLLNNANNELLFSAASLWEITIKNSLGRRTIARPIATLCISPPDSREAERSR